MRRARALAGEASPQPWLRTLAPRQEPRHAQPRVEAAFRSTDPDSVRRALPWRRVEPRRDSPRRTG